VHTHDRFDHLSQRNAALRTRSRQPNPGVHEPESFAIFVAVIVAIAGTMVWRFRRRD
jgi:hypothetical protein